MTLLRENAIIRWNGAGVYKTAALPTELIRQAADFLGFRQFSVNRERAKRAAEA